MTTGTGFQMGAYSYLGFAKETAWATAINPVTAFWPFETEALALKAPPQQINTAINALVTPTYSVPGRGAAGGTIGLPLFPDGGMDLVVGAIGAVSQVTGSTPTNSTTLSANVSAGATTITVASATGMATNDIVQIDTSASGVAECRKIVTIATNTLTLDVALDRAHTSGVTVATVVAPFFQSTIPGVLNSYTLEKYIPNDATSRQYPGSEVSKYGVTADAKGHVKASADIVAKDQTVLTGASVSAFVKPTTSPINFDQVTVSYAAAGTDIGGTFTSTTDVVTHSWDVDNKIKADETQNQSRRATRLYQTAKAITGKLTSYFTDETQLTNYTSDTAQAWQFKYLNTAGYGLIVNFPQVRIESFTEPIKIADLTRYDMGFFAEYNSSLGTHIQAQVISANYLPY